MPLTLQGLHLAYWMLSGSRWLFLSSLQEKRGTRQGWELVCVCVCVWTNVWVRVSGHFLDLLLQPPSKTSVTCPRESMWGDSRTMCGSFPESEWTCGRGLFWTCTSEHVRSCDIVTAVTSWRSCSLFHRWPGLSCESAPSLWNNLPEEIRQTPPPLILSSILSGFYSFLILNMFYFCISALLLCDFFSFLTFERCFLIKLILNIL